MDDKAEKVADRMRGLCSRREYCSGDIVRKIRMAYGIGAENAEDILQILVREGYVDDTRYARAFARDKSSIAGWGTVKIRHALALKGISEADIAGALKEIDTCRAGQRLERLMENRLKSLKGDSMCRLKMLRFGLGRGYGYEEVAYVVDTLLAENKQSCP